MSIAELRDLVIVIYGLLGVFLLLAIIVLAILFYVKVSSILDDVKSIMAKAKVITSYASKGIVEPLIGLSVIIKSAAEGLRQVQRIFTGKGRKS